MKSRRLFLPVLSLFVALAPAAHAQFGSGIVFDPTQSAHAVQQIEQGAHRLQTVQQIYTTTYRTMNQVIAAYNLAYQMSRMPQNLAARYKADFAMWTNLLAPNTYGNTSAWIDALNIGNSAQASQAYNSAIVQVHSYPSGNYLARWASLYYGRNHATLQRDFAESLNFFYNDLRSATLARVNKAKTLETFFSIPAHPTSISRSRLWFLKTCASFPNAPTSSSRRAGRGPSIVPYIAC